MHEIRGEEAAAAAFDALVEVARQHRADARQGLFGGLAERGVAPGLDDLEALPQYMLLEIEHFFTVYKDLEPGKSVEGATWVGREAAEAEIRASIERAKGTPYEHHKVDLA